jgi:Uri superfamily endonuclease
MSAFPSSHGIYLLVIYIDTPCRIRTGARGAMSFERGCYVYVGSAHGPGGLRARLERHARRDKALRWHIDYLTRRFTPIFALYWEHAPKAMECDLARLLSGYFEPVPSFGASDCRCGSHLFRLAGYR